MKASMPPLYRARPPASIRFLRDSCSLLSGLQALLLGLHGLIDSLSRELLGFLRLLKLLLPRRGAGGRRPHSLDATACQREQHDDWRESHGLLLPPRARASAEKGHLLLRTLVDDALCLADGALDRADLHVGADADVRLDAVPEAGGGSRVALDHYSEMIERAFLGDFEHVVRAQARLLEDQLLDLRRKHVDAADDQHVVGSTRDALHAPHGARGGRKEAS